GQWRDAGCPRDHRNVTLQARTPGSLREPPPLRLISALQILRSSGVVDPDPGGLSSTARRRQRPASKAGVRNPGPAVLANLIVVPLKPLELLDHHRTGKKRVRVLVREIAREENLAKA